MGFLLQSLTDYNPGFSWGCALVSNWTGKDSPSTFPRVVDGIHFLVAVGVGAACFFKAYK